MLQLSERTLGDWLEHWATVSPDKEYLVYSDRNLRFTWSQFNKRVDNMAKGLLAIGVEKGTHVGIWAGNVPDWLTFLYACAKIGAVAVTVNTNYKQPRTHEKQAFPVHAQCGLHRSGKIQGDVQHSGNTSSWKQHRR